jgi:ATP-dependent Zn protease
MRSVEHFRPVADQSSLRVRDKLGATACEPQGCKTAIESSLGVFVRRGALTLFIWLTLCGIVLVAHVGRNSESVSAPISKDRALTLIDTNRVDNYRLEQGQLLIGSEGQSFSVPVDDVPQVLDRLAKKDIPFEPERDNSTLTVLLVYLLGIVGIVLGVVYLLRKRSGGFQLSNILELRKSKARPVDNADKALFADIGGNRQAVELLADIVDFLRAPDRWTSAGLRIPRGVLIVGPPGTGKTLLARAVAGETKSEFFYTSATEFIELFVGVAAARIRDTFEKAVAKQPAVIFIDELDAIGRRRGSGLGVMHEEREQALNQLLVLMDGMERHKRLVVMAATNRPDVLDPALLRSGRFDRVLRLEVPTAEERLDILKIHARAKPMAPDLSLERIAEQTESFSGADLESLTNAAGLLAVRRTRDAAGGGRAPVTLTANDFERALDEMKKSNRLFDRLDALLVESVSQLAEPVGRATIRVTLDTENVVEGDVLWMNATHIKLRLADGSEMIVAKQSAALIASMHSGEQCSRNDVAPDRWAARSLDMG